MLCLSALFSDEPKVFLPKYFQTAMLHAAHFRSVVNAFKRFETILSVSGKQSESFWVVAGKAKNVIKSD